MNYVTQLSRSADRAEVMALYHAAGLSLTADLQKLNHAARISARPSAVRYLAENIAFDGQLPVPVLTMHTTGDGLVVAENEQAYRQVAEQAGDSAMLQQTFVHRAGHCAFTPAETITAAQTLLNRLNTGRWDLAALSPARLNAQATALGPSYNIYSAGSSIVPTRPPSSPTGQPRTCAVQPAHAMIPQMARAVLPKYAYCSGPRLPDASSGSAISMTCSGSSRAAVCARHFSAFRVRIGQIATSATAATWVSHVSPRG